MLLFTEDTVKSIFKANPEVTTIVIPDNVTRITQDAFCWHHEQIKELVLPESLTEITSKTFSDMKNLEKINIPSGIKSIGYCAFLGCCKLKEIVIPEGIEKIEESTFGNCSSLEEITFPSTLKEIGRTAFSGCTSLKKLALNEGLEEVIGDAGLEKGSVEELYIPSTLISADELIKNANYKKIVISEKNPVYKIMEIDGKNYVVNGSPENRMIAIGDAFTIDDSDVLVAETKDRNKYFHVAEVTITEKSSKDKKLQIKHCNFKTLIIGEGIEEIDLDECEIQKIVLSDSVKILRAPTTFNSFIKEMVFGKGIEEVTGVRFIETAYPSDSKEHKENAIVLPPSMKVFTPAVCGEVNEICLNEGLEKTGGFNKIKITEIKFPSTLKVIEPEAFKNIFLKEVSFPEGLEEIGEKAFENADFSEINFPASMKKVSGFSLNKNLKKITFHEGLEEIGENAFLQCAKLESVSFPSTVKKIGESAFSDCNKIQELVLPESLEEIGKWAFSCMNEIKEIRVPESCQIIDDYAFNGMYALGKITFPSKMKILGKYLFSELEELKELVLPEGIENLKENTFSYLKIDEIKIPDSVKSAEVTERIKDEFHGPFESCHIKKVIMGKGLVSIPDGLFSFGDIEEIVLPEGIKSIGAKAFKKCENLKKINIPSTLESFGNAIDVKKIVTALKRAGFTEIIVPEITSENAAAKTSAKKISPKLTPAAAKKTLDAEKKIATVPEGTEIIGARAFDGIETLEKVILPEGVVKIEDHAFRECNKLHEIVFPTTLKYYNPDSPLTVMNLSGTKSVTNYDSMRIINERYEGADVNIIEIPNTVKEIHFPNEPVIELNNDYEKIYIQEATEKILLGWKFSGANLKVFEIAEGNDYYEFKNHCLYNKKTQEVLMNFSDSLEITDEELHNVKSAGAVRKIKITDCPEVFRGKKGMVSLEEISLPEGMKTIGAYAFSAAKKLKSIKIPSTVTRIEDYAFSDCSSLEEIVLPEKLEYVGESVFSKCEKLKAIKIPEGVDTLPASLFEKCRSLSKIELPAGIKNISSYCFYDCASLESLDLSNATINYISNNCFEDCVKLKKVSLPDTITEIYEMAFKKSGIEEMIIPEGVKKINLCAFADCKNLKKLVLPSTLENMEEGVFSHCWSLESVQSSSPKYPVQDGFLFVKTTKRAIVCEGGGKTEINVPDFIKIIDQEYFFGPEISKLNFGDQSQLKEIDCRAANNSQLNHNVVFPLSEMLYKKKNAKEEKIAEIQKATSTAIISASIKDPKKVNVKHNDLDVMVNVVITGGSLVQFTVKYASVMQWMGKVPGFMAVLQKDNVTEEECRKAGEESGFKFMIIKMK